MNQSILKKSWTKVWTTEYSLFSVWLLGRGFTESCKKELGFYFDNFIVEIQGDLATGFRVDEEIKRFAADATRRIKHEPPFLDEVIRNMYDIKKNIESFFTLPISEILTDEKLKRLIDLLLRFLPYFILPLRAPDAFPESGLSAEEINVLFKKCEGARLATETFYTEIEKFLHKLFRHIAQKENIDEKLLRAIAPQELLDYSRSGKLPDISLLKRRYQNSVVVTTSEKNEIFLGDSAQEIIRHVSGLPSGTISQLEGVIAYKGYAKGTARLISHIDDMHKFKKGDILVSPMTRPEFLPVMKISAAYVTDAGGILCHAAIVARELKKPCIIGTKIATKVLKDGMSVEVDAEKGIVKIVS